MNPRKVGLHWGEIVKDYEIESCVAHALFYGKSQFIQWHHFHNIAFGNPPWWRAVSKLQICQCTLLHYASETVIRLYRERGSKISGGQRQRLALARAVWKTHRIDFRTSDLGLDSESEKFVQGLCLTYEESHFPGTLHPGSAPFARGRDFGDFFQQKGEQIVELGTHESLNSQNGLYKN